MGRLSKKYYKRYVKLSKSFTKLLKLIIEKTKIWT